MASKTFKDFSKPAIDAAWLNDVNKLAYGPGNAVDSSRISFTQLGTGATASTAEAELRAFIRPEQFGAIGDGTTDDTLALNKCFAYSGNVSTRDGAVYRCTSPLFRSGDINLKGEATLLFDFDTSTGLQMTANGVEGRASIKEVKFDGGSSLGRKRQITIRFNNYSRVSLRDSDIINQYNDATTTTVGGYFNDCTRIDVKGGVFKNIRALGNGVPGDAFGAVRGLYSAASKSLRPMVVADALFENIQTVNGAGVPIFDDADAVVVQNNGTFRQDLLIHDCEFINVGKRAGKSQANSSSTLLAHSNIIESTWSVTDPLLLTNDGMFSAFSAYGGRLVASNNIAVGLFTYFTESDSFPVDVLVSNNAFLPTKVVGIAGSNTRPFYHGTTGASKIVYSSNILGDAYAGGAVVGAAKVVVSNNINTSQKRAHDMQSISLGAFMGNIVSGDSTQLGEAFFFGTSIAKSISVNGNLIDNYYDGVYLASTLTPTFSATIGQNLYSSIARNPVSEFVVGAGGRIGYSGNFLDTPSSGGANKYLSQFSLTVGAAGAAAALPATPANYETVTVNGVQYKRPLYAV